MHRFALAVITGLSLSPSAFAGVEEPSSRFSEAERESFRQDLESIQQQFYQASPESRRRWIESLRQQRQQLDQQEEQASQSARKPRRSSAADASGLHVSRAALRPVRERVATP